MKTAVQSKIERTTVRLELEDAEPRDCQWGQGRYLPMFLTLVYRRVDDAPDCVLESVRLQGAKLKKDGTPSRQGSDETFHDGAPKWVEALAWTFQPGVTA